MPSLARRFETGDATSPSCATHRLPGMTRRTRRESIPGAVLKQARRRLSRLTQHVGIGAAHLYAAEGEVGQISGPSPPGPIARGGSRRLDSWATSDDRRDLAVERVYQRTGVLHRLLARHTRTHPCWHHGNNSLRVSKDVDKPVDRTKNAPDHGVA